MMSLEGFGWGRRRCIKRCCCKDLCLDTCHSIKYKLSNYWGVKTCAADTWSDSNKLRLLDQFNKMLFHTVSRLKCCLMFYVALKCWCGWKIAMESIIIFWQLQSGCWAIRHSWGAIFLTEFITILSCRCQNCQGGLSQERSRLQFPPIKN